MSLIDVLRKLGILRFGAKTAVYTSAKDRPAEFMMDNVYNAEKDLVTKQDSKNTLETVNGNCRKCGAVLKPGTGFCGSCNTPCL